MPTTRESQQPVIVVGGGIAGLSAAWRLQQAGLNVRVLERDPRPGGRMSTIDHDGFRIELGASILGTNYTHMRELISELGISTEFGPANDTCAFLRDGTVHRIRAQKKTDLLRTQIIGLRTKLALARVLPGFIAQRKHLDWETMANNVTLDSMSAADYVRRHLTPEAMKYLCEPLFGGGIVLASPEHLNAADMLFYAAKLLVPHFNSPHGTGLLTETLAQRVPTELNARVTSVTTSGNEVTVTWERPGEPEHTERAPAVIIALPAPHVPGIVPELPTDDARYLRSVPYSRTLGVSFGLDTPPNENAPYLFMTPDTHQDLVGIELLHNKMHRRVDNNQGLITLHVTEDFTNRLWHADDTTITDQALAAASAVFPKVSNDVLTSYVNRRDPALVVRPPGGYEALRAFNTRRHDADPRIQLAGDYFGPSSTYGALLSGERSAATLIQYLTVGTSPAEGPRTGARTAHQGKQAST